MKRKEIIETEQVNEAAPLVAALMGALVGMGLERNKAQQAAQQAVAQADQTAAPAQGQTAAPATGGAYTDTLKIGSRGDGVKELQTKLGMQQVDGIFGPATEKAVKTLQQSQGLTVDGIVGPNTKAAIDRLANNGTANGPEATQQAGQTTQTTAQSRGVNDLEGPEAAVAASQVRTGESTVKNNKNQINEASININGADASEVAEILRMMQLAGADSAKVVGTDDINPGPKPCPICGKMHGPSQPLGGCGAKPTEPDMGDMIRLMAPEEAVAEENDDGDFQDASTEPDETYMNDVSASIPSGNDLHKEKGSHHTVAGGDNPMNYKEYAESIKQRLYQALEEKKKR